MPLWRYLESGGKRAVAVWHRRAGKDEMCLHHCAVQMVKHPGTYWHMLPEAEQARKAIWNAINPHSGRRRIDEAFPVELRETTRENEMFIRLKGGSTWQVVGSDNFNKLVGSPPRGVVFSEYSVANPAAWAYIRPILAENGGWAVFIYTPRGRNHGFELYRAAKNDPNWFSQLLTARDTSVFSETALETEQRESIAQFGIELGSAYFDQEYLCSFDSAIMGAIYANAIRRVESLGQVRKVPITPLAPVHTAWDLGFDDLTAIWFWQQIGNEVHLVDYYENSGQDTEFYCGVLVEKGYSYGRHYVPHDAAHQLMAAGGRSIIQQAWERGVKMDVIPATSQANQIAAARKTIPSCWFDEDRCAKGLDALRSYQFEWDDAKRTLKTSPRHDWSSHACDAFEIISQVWQGPKRETVPDKPRFFNDLTANELFYPKPKAPARPERI
jgi:phage terminase large subunit